MKIVMMDDADNPLWSTDDLDVDANVRAEIWEQISDVVSEYI